MDNSVVLVSTHQLTPVEDGALPTPSQIEPCVHNPAFPSLYTFPIDAQVIEEASMKNAGMHDL
jgi:hypothetical protein